MDSILMAIFAMGFGLALGSIWKGDDVAADCNKLQKARIAGAVYECRKAVTP